MKKAFTISAAALFTASIILLLVTYANNLSKAKESDKQTVDIGEVVAVKCPKTSCENCPYYSSGKTTDIYLVDASGKTKLFGTFSDIYGNQDNCAEYHNGNVYVIRRVNYENYPDPNDDWNDELWKISPDKTEQKLYGARGLDFRVSPDESTIMLQGSHDDNYISLMNSLTGETKNILKSELGVVNDASIQFEGWSDNSEKFWGQLFHTEKPIYFTVTKTGEITIYNSPHSFYVEHSLNTNTGVVAYSEYPHFFDMESLKEYEAKGEKVNFYLFNLQTKEKTLIATSVVKEFQLKWIDDRTVEYNNPADDSRIKYSLENGKI